MSTPAPGLTVTADKAQYNVGDPIVVTIQNENGGEQLVDLVVTASAVAADGSTLEGTTTVQVNAAAAPLDLQSGQVTDSFGDSYAQQSLDGATAVFASTVGTPPAA